MLEHNEVTLKELESYVAKGQDCCVVNPCGSGKSSVMSEFIKNHKESSMIIFTRQKNAESYYRRLNPAFKTINVFTYNRMLHDYKKGNTGKYKADFYLADEAHYIGADKWGDAFNSLCNTYHPIVVGFTATPQRFSDQGTDETIVTSFFSGHSAGNYTSAQLQKKGVFIEPEYILSLYDLESGIEDRMDRIDESDLSDEVKSRYKSMLASMLEDWNASSRPEKVLKEAVPRYLYKEKNNRILVYCPEVGTIDEKRQELDSIFKSICGNSVKSYKYTYRETEDVLNDFLAESDDYVKVLYSVDKIMETIHIDDMSILLMLRPSVSNRIITQQFGRINSIGNRNKSLIIDMVNNLANIGKINFLGGSVSGNKSGDGVKHSVNIDYLTKYSDIFNMIDKALVKSHYYCYKGFTGSLSQICNLYNKNYSEVRYLIEKEGLDIEEALNRVRRTKPLIRDEIFAGYVKPHEFELSDSQKPLVEKYMPLVERFAKNHSIKDEDIIQELYLELMYRISTKESEEGMRAFLINAINNKYAQIWRHKVIREGLFAEKSIDQIRLKQDDMLCENYMMKELSQNIIPNALEKLKERETKILKMRMGFNGEPKTLEETGKTFNVKRERVRQIEAKTLRKMRHPSFSKNLWDCMQIMIQNPNNENKWELAGKKERIIY